MSIVKLLTRGHGGLRSRDKINISIEFNGVNLLRYEIYSKLTESSHFLPFIVDMPTLMGKLSSTYESGARYLVDKGYIDKEDMRKILEESIRDSIEEMNKLLDTVKLDDIKEITT